MRQALKEKRKAVGLTQMQVAKSAGVTERGSRRYEASDNAATEPNVTTGIRIAQALGVKDFDEFQKLWGNPNVKPIIA